MNKNTVEIITYTLTKEDIDLAIKSFLKTKGENNIEFYKLDSPDDTLITIKYIRQYPESY